MLVVFLTDSLKMANVVVTHVVVIEKSEEILSYNLKLTWFIKHLLEEQWITLQTACNIFKTKC